MRDVPLVSVVASNGRSEQSVNVGRRQPAVVEGLAEIASGMSQSGERQHGRNPAFGVDRLCGLLASGVDIPLFRFPARRRRLRQLNRLLEKPCSPLQRIGGREPVVNCFQSI
jgi:hypothetical protein